MGTRTKPYMYCRDQSGFAIRMSSVLCFELVSKRIERTSCEERLQALMIEERTRLEGAFLGRVAPNNTVK